MAKFQYKAIDATGENVGGIITAESLAAAREQLLAAGFAVTDLAEISEVVVPGTPSGNQTKLSSREMRAVSGHAVSLAQAKLPLAPGLRALAAEPFAKSYRRAFLEVAAALENGQSMAEIADSAKVPGPLVGLFEAGERIGHFDLVVSQYRALAYTFYRQRILLLQSLVYPAVVMCYCVLLLWFLAAYLVPDFRDIFEGFGMDLPEMTKLVLAVSRFMELYGGLLLLLVVAGVVLIWLLLRFGLSKIARDRLLNALPIWGAIRRSRSVAEWMNVLAVLLDSRVPLPEALRDSGAASGDAQIAVAADRLADSVAAGTPLSGAVDQLRGFPINVLRIAKGADAEQLPGTVRMLADVHRSRTENHFELLSVAMEPLVMVMSGLTVGFFVLSLFLPLIKMLNELS